MLVHSQHRELSVECCHFPAMLYFSSHLKSLKTSQPYLVLLFYPEMLPSVSATRLSPVHFGTWKASSEELQSLLVPYQGGIKIWCICNVSSSFLRTCKRSSCAVNLVRPQAFHSTSILLDLHSRAYIIFLCQESVGKKILIELLALPEKSKSPKRCNGCSAFCKYIFCMLVYERIFLVVSLCKKKDQRENTLFFNICRGLFYLFLII